MRRCLLMVLLALSFSAVSMAQQGVVGDVLAGNLVKPKVGQWAWYELKDASSGQRFALRQAVVGQEKVKGKTGYWVELEIIPPVGYKSVYKMLLTGPASDPKHLHRVLVREGLAPPQEIQIPEDEPADGAKPPETKQESLGMEDIETPGGVVEAEHLKLITGDDTSEVWVNDKVRPMGVVKMVSSDGELLLRSYGEEGDDARSVIDDDAVMGEGLPVQEPKVEVRVGGEERGESPDAAPTTTTSPETNEPAANESTP